MSDGVVSSRGFVSDGIVSSRGDAPDAASNESLSGPGFTAFPGLGDCEVNILTARKAKGSTSRATLMLLEEDATYPRMSDQSSRGAAVMLMPSPASSIFASAGFANE